MSENQVRSGSKMEPRPESLNFPNNPNINLNNSTPRAPICMQFFSAGSYDPKLSEKSSLVKISRPGRPPGLAVRAKRAKKNSVNALETLITPLPVSQSACSLFLQVAMILNCLKNPAWSKSRGLGGPQGWLCEPNEQKTLLPH